MWRFNVKGTTGDGHELVTIQAYYPSKVFKPLCDGYLVPFSRGVCDDLPWGQFAHVQEDQPALWRLIPDKDNVSFRILAHNRSANCFRYLGAYSECNDTQLALSKSFGASGRQGWTLEEVYPAPNITLAIALNLTTGEITFQPPVGSTVCTVLNVQTNAKLTVAAIFPNTNAVVGILPDAQTTSFTVVCETKGDALSRVSSTVQITSPPLPAPAPSPTLSPSTLPAPAPSPTLSPSPSITNARPKSPTSAAFTIVPPLNPGCTIVYYEIRYTNLATNEVSIAGWVEQNLDVTLTGLANGGDYSITVSGVCTTYSDRTSPAEPAVIDLPLGVIDLPLG
jgi:hypothetical protein